MELSKTNIEQQTTPPILSRKELERQNTISIRILFLTMFFSSVGFSITLPSIWPYLKELDRNVTKDALGLVVAIFSVGQLLGGLIFGFIIHVRSSFKYPLIAAICFIFLGNIFYANLQLSKSENARSYLILSRFIVGFGSGNVAISRTFVTAFSSAEQKTGQVALMSAFQGLGFIFGPSIQTCFIPLHYPSVINYKYLSFNMFTASGYMGALSSIVNIILILKYFHDRDPHISMDNSMAPNETNVEVLLLKAFVEKSRLRELGQAVMSLKKSVSIMESFITRSISKRMDSTSKTKSDITRSESTSIIAIGVPSSFRDVGTNTLLKSKSRDSSVYLKGLSIQYYTEVLKVPSNIEVIEIDTPDLSNISVIDNICNEQIDNGSDLNKRMNSSFTFPKDCYRNYSPNKLEIPGYLHEHESTGTFKKTSEKNCDCNDIGIAGTAHTCLVETKSEFPSISMYSTNFQTDNETRTVFHETWSKINNSLKYGYFSRFCAGAPGKVDYFIVNLIMVISFTTMILFSSLETILTPMLMDNFAYDLERATLNASLFLAFCGVIAIFVFIIINFSTKKFSNRNHLIIGQTLCLLTCFVLIPMGTDPLVIKINGTVGCPVEEQNWCLTSPALSLYALLISLFTFTFGYAICSVMTTVLFSMALGPGSQALWMGVFTAFGSLSRIIGPLYVTSVYASKGLSYVFGFMTAFNLVILILIFLFYYRIVSFQRK